MTDVAANSSMSRGVTQRQTEPPAGPPPIVSARVRAITYAIVVLAHVGVFAAFITWAKPDVIALTGGGPGRDTWLPSVFMYQYTFTRNEMGVGAASAVIMLIAVATVVVPYIRSEIRQARRSS